MYYPLSVLPPKLKFDTIVCKTSGAHSKAEMEGDVPLGTYCSRLQTGRGEGCANHWHRLERAVPRTQHKAPKRSLPVPQLLAEAIFLPHFFVKKDSNNNPLPKQQSDASAPSVGGGDLFCAFEGGGLF